MFAVGSLLALIALAICFLVAGGLELGGRVAAVAVKEAPKGSSNTAGQKVSTPATVRPTHLCRPLLHVQLGTEITSLRSGGLHQQEEQEEHVSSWTAPRTRRAKRVLLKSQMVKGLPTLRRLADRERRQHRNKSSSSSSSSNSSGSSDSSSCSSARKEALEALNVLSERLTEGLSYLGPEDLEELQMALQAVAACHTNRLGFVAGMEKVKEDAEVCLILGLLEMDTDTLLAALLNRTNLGDEVEKERSTAKPQGFGVPLLTSEMKALFGEPVTELVQSYKRVRFIEGLAKDYLTNHKPASLTTKLDHQSMQEQLDHLRNLILSEVEDCRVLILRVATHLQRLRSVTDTDGRVDPVKRSRADELANDAFQVHGPLAHRLGIHSISSELENLAFRQLHPADFAEVTRQMQENDQLFDHMLDTVGSDLIAELEENHGFLRDIETVSLAGRTKEPYSMWRKMQKRGCGVADILDAVALRVVLKARRKEGDRQPDYSARSARLCYEVMEIVKQRWSVLPQATKDYVTNPKPNGYQSLHTTAIMEADGGEGSDQLLLLPFEVQVRSFEMHQQAEYGKAAHWAYKGQGSTSVLTDGSSSERGRSSSQGNSLRGDRSRGSGSSEQLPQLFRNGLEFTNWLHDELQLQKVYIFGPDGLIWDLKAGVRAADFLQHMYIREFYTNQRALSVGQRQVNVNGLVVPKDYKLNNGDVVMME